MILLMTRYEVGKEAMRVMAQKNSRDRRILGLSRRCSRIKNQLTEYLKIELGNIKILFTELLLIKQFRYLGLEVFFQMALQIILLLLTKTETATTSGLQTFFEQPSLFGIDSTVLVRWGLLGRCLRRLT